MTAVTSLGFECKHALYVKDNQQGHRDLIFVKEREHFSDGTCVPKTRLVENYKRPFWVTRPLHRTHRDKKEWEDENKLQRFMTTQVDLVKNAARALGVSEPPNRQLRTLARSPYLYGADITSTALLKKSYMQHFPGLISDSTVAVSDTETDMLEGHEQIIMQSLTMKDKAHLVIVESFIDKVLNFDQSFKEACERYLQPYLKERGTQITYSIVQNPGQVVKEILDTAHRWQPDFLVFWNMDFDIKKMEQALDTYGFDKAMAWSDPSVPEHYRHYWYRQGASQKVTSSGKYMPLHPAERWHSVHAPASFYVLDAMCVYLKLRIAKGKEPSYSLDAILSKELKNVQKLKFEEASHLKGASWHRFMQRFHPVEYCVYNLFDCISVELLDEKTTDIRRQVGLMCEHSDFDKFPSQPRRTCDDLHFVTLEKKKVIATTSDEMIDPYDKYIVGVENWIVTLRSDLTHDTGLAIIEELPGQPTMLRRDVADLDVAGTYPNGQILLNLSKETTAKELCSMEGVSEALQRSIGINLTGGHVNAVEIVTGLYKAPTFRELLAYANGEALPVDHLEESLKRQVSQMEYVQELIEEDQEDTDEES